MELRLPRGFFVAICLLLCKGSRSGDPATPVKFCGNWMPYQDGKCFKIMDAAGSKNEAKAQTVCTSYYSRLVTVKTSKQQKFLQQFLFGDNQLVESVWLGLKKNEGSSEFRWNDGSEMFFNNLVHQNISNNNYPCVAMTSGKNDHEEGLWVRVDCEKNNTVVCERGPTTMNTSDTRVMRDAPEQVVVQKELEEKILLTAEKECNEKYGLLKQASLQTRDLIKEAAEKITAGIDHVSMAPGSRIDHSLKQTAVPIGFVYVQLPGQDPPTTLWPQTSWKDVGSQYAGLFFRVEGGGAAPFGQLQEDNTRRLRQMRTIGSDEDDGQDIPTDGSWSKGVWTGITGNGRRLTLHVQLTTGEVRPRNKSIKIWQRFK